MIGNIFKCYVVFEIFGNIFGSNNHILINFII